MCLNRRNWKKSTKTFFKKKQTRILTNCLYLMQWCMFVTFNLKSVKHVSIDNEINKKLFFLRSKVNIRQANVIALFSILFTSIGNSHCLQNYYAFKKSKICCNWTMIHWFIYYLLISFAFNCFASCFLMRKPKTRFVIFVLYRN